MRRRLTDEYAGQRFFAPSLCALFVLCVTLAENMALLSLALSREDLVRFSLLILCVGVVLALAGFVILSARRHLTMAKAARKVDGTHAGRSRLEACVELHYSANPLKTPQRNNTAVFYVGLRHTAWGLGLALVMVAGLAVIAFDALMIYCLLYTSPSPRD